MKRTVLLAAVILASGWMASRVTAQVYPFFREANSDAIKTAIETVAGWNQAFLAVQSGTWSVRAQDGSGNALTSTSAGSARALDVIIRDSAGDAVGASSVCGDDSLVESVASSPSSSGNNQLVALSGSEVITVCGFHISGGAAVDVQLITGTGSACATGETDKTPAFQLDGDAGLRGVNVGFGGQKLFAGGAGEALCAELSGAVGVDIFVAYVQQ